jgi:hypothetical protein
MAGDYTRITFDPLRDRAMLLEQQGRVHLDADFNELVSILERRLRVETRDFTGPAVVPATLPHSFEIKLTGSKVTIGPGRMYVDGLLAENHGFGNPIYEPVWDEPDYDGWTPIDQQPYQGTALPPTVKGNQLVYLDVWQREETYVEDASLLESALGVDTCTRVQTAWQVRMLDLGGKTITCADDVPGFPPLPSAGRLTSRAIQPPAPSDPCAVAPVGGYRGLENRLYRVEIHDGGAAGAATFKWSRDNGAVASAVTAVDNPANAQVITVERLGRDQVLRFHQNEWVELLDDTHELDGHPGLMGQVLRTDPTENTVTLAAPLAGAIDLGRNPRLRRWDEQDGVNANGVIPIPALPSAFISLEDGVEVELALSDPAGELKTGDWWVFAARAATASIEELQAAPPRGIRHHYARLAVITGNGVTDCRVIFPGTCECEGDGCECAACVTPASHASGALTIQGAIDKVAATGGRVCLEPGRYDLREPLRIRRARSLTLAGAGSATMITYEGKLGFGILVEDCVEVSLERFALAVAGSRGAVGTVGIALANTAVCRVERCLVLVGLVPGAKKTPSFNPADVGIGLSGWALRTRLLENVVLASTAIGDITGARSGALVHKTAAPVELGVQPAALKTTAVAASFSNLEAQTGYLASGDLAIVDNMLLGRLAGIDFAGTLVSGKTPASPTLHLGLTRIADNLILGAMTAGILLFGLGAQPQGAFSSGAAPVNLDAGSGIGLGGFAGLQLGAGEIAVTGNALLVAGDGIRATPDALRITDNQIGGAMTPTSTQTTGVSLAANRGAPGGHATVTGNLVRGFGLGGVITSGPVGSLTVSSNRIMDVGSVGVAITGISVPGDATVTDNTISQVGRGRGDEGTLRGVWVLGTAVVRITGNVIRRVGAAGWQGKELVGVQLTLCETGEVAGNMLTEIGPATEHVGWVVGIAAGRFTSTLDVRGNTATLGAGGGVSRDTPLLVGEKFGGASSLASRLALFQLPIKGPVVGPAVEGQDPVPAGRPDLGVHGNTLSARGRERTVLIVAEANVLLGENRCRRLGQPAGGPVVFIDVSGATIVASNRVEGASADVRAIDLHVDQGAAGDPHCTVLGNITDGPIELNDNPLAAPWAPLNIIA